MSDELHRCAISGTPERVKELVEGGANIDANNAHGVTALMLASIMGRFEVVVCLVECGANVAQSDRLGMTALLYSVRGSLPTVKYLLEHGSRIIERDDAGKTALLHAAVEGASLKVIEFLLSPEGGARITEIDDGGNTALLLAARNGFNRPMVQWLLEYGGAQITDTDNEGHSLWTGDRLGCLPDMLRGAYTKNYDGEYVPIDRSSGMVSLMRIMVLHGGPPESLVVDLAPPLQRIVEEGARLQARLPAYLAQRLALLDAHCPLLAPLTALIHGYEKPTTTDELWATDSEHHCTAISDIDPRSA
jgi:ankyrin repeat protein